METDQLLAIQKRDDYEKTDIKNQIANVAAKKALMEAEAAGTPAYVTAKNVFD